MAKRILFVDDDPMVLQAIQRQLRKEFEIQTAEGGESALHLIRTAGPIAVVVTDLQMPGMNGIELLARVRDISPDAVRIMMTGHADLNTAMAAVNDGRVFQFLTKPCPPEALERVLRAGLEKHRLIASEREVIEGTLRGSIDAMSEILALVNPVAFSRAQRIRRYVQHIAEKLRLPERWQYELAAMLSQIGYVTVPPSILAKADRGAVLTAEEKRVLSSQGTIGHDLLVKIPRLENVAKIVASQSSSRDELGPVPEVVRTGVALLHIALDLDAQIAQGKPFRLALMDMTRNGLYRSDLLLALQHLPAEDSCWRSRLVALSELRPKMIVNDAIYSKTGVLLLPKGQEVTEWAIARLNSFASFFGIVEPINVMVPQAEESPELIAPVIGYCEPAKTLVN